MLAHCLRSWPKIKTTLGQCLVFDGNCLIVLIKCLRSKKKNCLFSISWLNNQLFFFFSDTKVLTNNELTNNVSNDWPDCLVKYLVIETDLCPNIHLDPDQRSRSILNVSSMLEFTRLKRVTVHSSPASVRPWPDTRRRRVNSADEGIPFWAVTYWHMMWSFCVLIWSRRSLWSGTAASRGCHVFLWRQQSLINIIDQDISNNNTSYELSPPGLPRREEDKQRPASTLSHLVCSAFNNGKNYRLFMRGVTPTLGRFSKDLFENGWNYMKYRWIPSLNFKRWSDHGDT